MPADGGYGNPRRPSYDLPPEDGITASVQTEQYLLAGLINNPAAIEAMPEGFGPRYFAGTDHGDIYEAVVRAAEQGGSRILPVLEDMLPHIAGPGQYLKQLAANLVSARANDLRLYALTVKEMEERRQLLSLAKHIEAQLSRTEEGRQPVPAIINQALARLEEIGSAQQAKRGAISLAEAMGNAIRIGEEAHARGDGLSGVTTGFRCLNRRLRGFLKSTLHIIAARPGMGKTALGLQIAIRAALEGNVVLYISLEMEAEQLAQRALGQLANLSLDDVMSGAFADPETPGAAAMASRMLRAQEKMAAIALDIEDEPALTPANIKMRIKGAIRRHGRVDMVIVDHLHLMGKSANGQKHGPVVATTENSNGLLALGKEFRLAMVALAQLSRGVEQREDKRPMLSDLRESGAIEQDASTVTFLYREAYYAARESQEERPGESEAKRLDRIARLQRILQNTANKAELICAKVRMGQVGTEFVGFDGPRTRFFEEEDRA